MAFLPFRLYPTPTLKTKTAPSPRTPEFRASIRAHPDRVRSFTLQKSKVSPGGWVVLQNGRYFDEFEVPRGFRVERYQTRWMNEKIAFVFGRE